MNEFHVGRAVGDTAVPEALRQLALLDEEDAGHLAHGFGGEPDAVAAEEAGDEDSPPGFGSEQLPEFPVFQAEGGVEAAVEIADAVDGGEAVAFDELAHFLAVAHVDEDDAGAGAFDFGAVAGDVAQRFAAKSTARVAQEDEENGRFFDQRNEVETGLGPGGFEDVGNLIAYFFSHRL